MKQIARNIKEGLYHELADKRITELIRDSDGFRYTLMKIDQYAGEARKNLDVFPNSVPKQKLLEFVDDIQLSAHKMTADPCYLGTISEEDYDKKRKMEISCTKSWR